MSISDSMILWYINYHISHLLVEHGRGLGIQITDILVMPRMTQPSSIQNGLINHR